MRRSIARGRMVPQSWSTDPRMGRVSLKAVTLLYQMWINCDDQGRCSGDPDEIKYTACPNLPDISKEDIPNLLKELAATKSAFLRVYTTTSGTEAIQMLDWWQVQKLQWAYPSNYPPPEGWTDHLRYHPIPTEIITEDWPPPGQLASELLPSKPASKSPSALPSKPASKTPSALPSKPASKTPSALPSKLEASPLTTPLVKEKEEGKGKGRGRGRLPSGLPGALGNKSAPSLTTDQPEILRELTKCFKIEWGRVPAREPEKVIPREPGARESAQLRDLAKELSTRGGVPLGYLKEAFREAAGQKKFHISYVRAILLDWLGLEREPPV